MIYDVDWEFLTTMYGPTSELRTGVSTVLREVIHMAVQKLRDSAEHLERVG
jgi:hypothetical protein